MKIRVDGHRAQVPAGRYVLKYVGHSVGRSWNKPKLTVNFTIVEGEYASISIPRHYNLGDPRAEPEGEADYSIGPGSALATEFFALFPDSVSVSDIDLSLLRDKRILARVGTVTRSGTKKEKAPANQYSVIRELLEILPEEYEPIGTY